MRMVVTFTGSASGGLLLASKIVALVEEAHGASFVIEQDGLAQTPLTETDLKRNRARPVGELRVSARVCNLLLRHGITTVGDLCQRTLDDLLYIRNLGPRGIDEIQLRLEALGLSLKG
jgi:DNA-directed RNA polymerase alpha subunit